MNEILLSQIKKGELFHAYIFEANKQDVEGMYTEFIEKIYESQDYRSKDMKLDRFFDVEVIKAEKDYISLERIREMKKKVFEIPLEASYKIFIVEDAHLMRAEAQNALLKTLEEAPEYAIIILTTDNRNKLLNTILSRCQIISYKSDKQGDELDTEMQASILNLLVDSLNSKAFKIVGSREIFEKKVLNKRQVVNFIEEFFMNLIIFKSGIDIDKVSYAKTLEKFSSLSIKKIENLILKLEKMNEMIQVNVNFQTLIEDFMFALMEE